MIHLSRGAAVNVAQRPRQFFHFFDRWVPERLPLLTGVALQVFRAMWVVALVFAVVGPLGGLWLRVNSPPRLSQSILGSRAGIFVSPSDATLVRFTIGRAPRKLGIGPGDKIIAVYGLPLPNVMPLNERALAEHSNDPAYIGMGNVLYGTDSANVPLRIRHPDGRVNNVVVWTGETYANDAARGLEISPRVLDLIDLIHVLIYPILLWVAFSIYSRNRRHVIPALLSSSILLTLIAEQPSSLFLARVGVPLRLNIFLFDVGNILLLATLMLFPDGRPRPRIVLIALCCLPILFFLRGALYQWTFLSAGGVGLLILIKRLREATGVTRRQLKFLLAGLAAYPALRTLSVVLDTVKYLASSLSQFLLFETGARVAFGLARLSLLLVLFAALRRHRLYDADALFPRSVMIGALTLTIGAFFAAASASLQWTADALGQESGPWPSLIAAAAAVLLISPVQKRIHRGTERWLQKDLFTFRTELPKRMDDLRETESAAVLLQVAVGEIVQGVGATACAAIIAGRVVASAGCGRTDVRRWVRSTELPDPPLFSCNREDHLFPVRLPLRTAGHPRSLIGWIVLAPRPDGSIYSREERQALMDVEESISRAVEVARQRQQAQSEERRWRVGIEKRVSTLEQAMADFFVTGPQKKARA